MFDQKSMISSEIDLEEKQRIEKIFDNNMLGFEKITKDICDYVNNVGYTASDSSIVFEIAINRIKKLKEKIQTELLASFALSGDNPPEDIKQERLKFYRKLSAYVAEIIFHSVTIYNFHINESADDDHKITSEILHAARKKIEDDIVVAFKISAVHGLDIKKILSEFIKLKNDSFMPIDQAIRNLQNAKYHIQRGNILKEYNLSEFVLAKAYQDKYVIKIGCTETEKEDDSNGIYIVYNPHGFDDEIFKLIPVSNLFVDLDEKVQKGFIPSSYKQDRVTH